jgi:hypothetical protein
VCRNIGASCLQPDLANGLVAMSSFSSTRRDATQLSRSIDIQDPIVTKLDAVLLSVILESNIVFQWKFRTAALVFAQAASFASVTLRRTVTNVA